MTYCGLLTAFKSLLPEMDSSFALHEWRGFTELEKVVFAINEYDPGSYSFRYPITKDGQPSLPHFGTVNVTVLQSDISEAAICLAEIYQVIEEAQFAMELPKLYREWFGIEQWSEYY